ncbi:MAG TPA: arsenic resistance N-acetyltransferase ArsN2 [Acidobacteriota bacterium]|nr:arsenic resistance N-acetyltransferase ArsN2 [Acidobacteriota bacterium]
MDSPKDIERMGAVLRETARLHLQLQRLAVAGCDQTTSTQCFIIGELGRNGTLTLAALARRVGLDKSWTSRAVESLVQGGLIAKVQSDEDRRTVQLSLTETGQRRFENLNTVLDAQAERALNRIDATQQPQIFEALRLIRDALQTELSGSVVGGVSEVQPGIELTFQPVGPDQLGSIRNLLLDSHLPVAGIESPNLELTGMYRTGKLVGCAGLERYGKDALLRSVAVAESERGNGVGKQLVSRLLGQAAQQQLKKIVLLTTTAETFFRRFGFQKIPRSQAPKSVLASVEFQTVCPQTATVMVYRVPK